MHRHPLLSLISNYRRHHPDETEVIDRLTAFVDTHVNCFDRQLAIGHVTGSAWLVNRAGTSVLLTHHRKLDKWLQLGGHADGHSDVLSVALREAFEESGLEALTPISKEIFDLDIHRIPERGREKAHNHYDIRFALQAQGSERFKVSEESHALSWILLGQLEKIAPDRSIQRMQGKWLSYHRRQAISNIDAYPFQ